MFRNIVLIFAFYGSLCDSRQLKIAWIVPTPSSNYPINNATSSAAMALALRTIERNSQLLNGHTVGMRMFETDCTSTSGMMAAMTANRTYDPDVIIGPPCSDAMSTVADFASIYNTPLFSWYTPSPEFDNYNNLIRLHPPMKSLATALTHTLQERGEFHVSVVYAPTEPHTMLKDSVIKELPLSNIQVNNVQMFTPGLTDANIDQMLVDMKNYGKNVILMTSADDVRRIMLAAARTSMTAEQYKFIHLDPQIYTNTELNNMVMGEGYWKRGDPLDTTARQAYNSLTHMIIDPMNDDQNPTIQSPKSRFEEFSALGAKVTQGSGNPGTSDVYSQFLYDTTSAWAVLANQMLLDNASVRDGAAMAERAKIFRAEGSTGYISIDNNADRIAKVFELGMGSNGAFLPSKILQFDPVTSLYNTQIVKQAKPTVSQTSQFAMSEVSQTEQYQPSMPPTSAVSKSTKAAVAATDATAATHATAVQAISPTVAKATSMTSAQVSPVANHGSINSLLDRLSKLEAAITKVMNHDHRTDHPPHELPQPVIAPHHHPPGTHAHTASAPHSPAATNSLAAPHPSALPKARSSGLSMSPTLPFMPKDTKTAPKQTHPTSSETQPKLSKVPGTTSAKASSSNSNIDTLTSQILKKLTGVIDKRLGSLGTNQGGSSGEAPPPKAKKAAPQTEAPPPQPKNGGGGGGEAAMGERQGERHQMSADYIESMNRLREEVGLPPGFGLFFNYPPFVPSPFARRPMGVRNQGITQQPPIVTSTPHYWIDYGLW